MLAAAVTTATAGKRTPAVGLNDNISKKSLAIYIIRYCGLALTRLFNITLLKVDGNEK
jgi:hypothetical protein